MKNNHLFFFFSILVLTLILSHFSKELLDTDKLLVNTLIESLTGDQINEILEAKNKWQWLSYVIVPLLLLIKISLITALIDMGCFFFNQKLKYKAIFNMVVKAEFVFLLVIVFKTAWFYFFQPNYTLQDLQYFYPLSAINIVGYDGLDPWWVYPFQVLNLFELAYWFILAYLLGKAINANTNKGLSIVASSYGVSLLIWVVGVMFFTLNMS